jgi:hypothetical protein
MYEKSVKLHIWYGSIVGPLFGVMAASPRDNISITNLK